MLSVGVILVLDLVLDLGLRQVVGIDVCLGLRHFCLDLIFISTHLGLALGLSLHILLRHRLIVGGQIYDY